MIQTNDWIQSKRIIGNHQVRTVRSYDNFDIMAARCGKVFLTPDVVKLPIEPDQKCEECRTAF